MKLLRVKKLSIWLLSALVIIVTNSRQILTINSSHFEQSFYSVFCTNCNCQRNLMNVNTSDTNFFQPQVFYRNSSGDAHVMFGNITADYFFPNDVILTQAEMEYFVMYPYQNVKPKGVILYYHPTLFGKLQVPTKLQKQILSVCGLYVTAGYIIVVPNYIGYEKKSCTPHPYVTYPQTNVQAAIFVLNNISEKIKQISKLTSINLYTVGYSEGAAYSLYTETCISNPSKCFYVKTKLQSFYNLKGSVGLDGPYSLQDVVYNFLSNNVSLTSQYKIKYQVQTNLGKPGLIAMSFLSFSYFNTKQPQSLLYYLNISFARMYCDKYPQEKCNIGNYTSRVDIDQALQSENSTSLSIAQAIAFSALGKQMNNMKYLIPQNQAILLEHRNTMMALISTYKFQKFKDLLAQSQVIKNAPTKPIFIVSLMRDSIVSVLNLQKYIQSYKYVAYKKIPNQIHKVCLNYLQQSDVDHNGAQLLANLYALAYIDKLK